VPNCRSASAARAGCDAVGVIRSIDLSAEGVAESVVDIQRAAYRVEADLIGFDDIPPLHEDAPQVRQHRLKWLGSWEGDRLAGVIGWTLDGGVCDIDRLAVHPDFARRGHGRGLVRKLLNHRMITVSTGTENAPARRLYESLGFVRVGEVRTSPEVTTTQYVRRT